MSHSNPDVKVLYDGDHILKLRIERYHDDTLLVKFIDSNDKMYELRYDLDLVDYERMLES